MAYSVTLNFKLFLVSMDTLTIHAFFGGGGMCVCKRGGVWIGNFFIFFKIIVVVYTSYIREGNFKLA